MFQLPRRAAAVSISGCRVASQFQRRSESSVPVFADASLLKETGYINGAWLKALDGAEFSVTDPANGNHIAFVPDMAENETNAAIEAAHAAGPAWAGLLAKERSAILQDW